MVYKLSDFKDKIRAWVALHPGVSCVGTEHRELEEEYLKACSGKTGQQASVAVQNALRAVRPIIAPRKTNKAYAPKAIGAATALHPVEMKKRNDVHNPVNNPVNNAKAREKRLDKTSPQYKTYRAALDKRLEANKAHRLALIQADPYMAKHALSEAQVKKKVQEILGKPFDDR